MATTGNEDATDKDWMFDYLLSLLKSPQWDISIMGFIDENCAVFDTDDENKLSYTSLHRQFKDLVNLADESIVSAKMTEVSKECTAQPIVCCLLLYTRHEQTRFLFDVLTQSKYILDNRNEQVETLCSSSLADVGIGIEDFVDALEASKLRQDISKSVYEQLIAVDDFVTFKKLMVSPYRDP